MSELRYTLLSDGSSDRALLPILTWLLRQHLPGRAIQEAWADFRRLPSPPDDLAERIDLATDLYPCDLLFVHRDAEGEPRETRARQIQQARSASRSPGFPAVCVIPVRMTEAWLLISESAIRRASGNPNGRVPLDVPHLSEVEGIPDPKTVLHGLLRTASERTGRGLKKVRVARCALQVSGFVDDFSPLRRLPAFTALEGDLQEAIRHEAGCLGRTPRSD